MAAAIPDDSQDLRDHLDSKVWRKPPYRESLPMLREPRPDDLRLYAMIATFEESDIVEAAVRNCLVHGCDRVYLIDNASQDGTAEIAAASGAIVAEVWQTDFYRDEQRLGKMNRIEERITTEERHPVLWWLTLDCDEFIHVPGGGTLRQYLARLDPRCDMVGAYSWDHYPTPGIHPANVPGFHPAMFQPLVMRRILKVCPREHWKHPVLRYVNGEWNTCHTRGLHAPFTKRGTVLNGPSDGLMLHHFMFREEAFTRNRLDIMCRPREDGTRRSDVDDRRLGGEGAIKRWRNLDHVYAGRFDQAELTHAQAYARKVGIPVEHWTKIATPTEYMPLLWHSEGDASAAFARWREEHGLPPVVFVANAEEPERIEVRTTTQEATMPASTASLAFTQFLCFEIGRECNLCGAHAGKCPSGDLTRYGLLDTSRELDDSTILECVKAAVEMGFRGEVAWHYYNEPMLSWERIRALMIDIREEWPEARFCLWTNGTQFPDDLSELSEIDDVWVSNYARNDWKQILSPHVKAVHVLTGQLDGRKALGKPTSGECLRPFNEMVIDHYGNGHLCCADWRGEIHIGNVFRDGFKATAERYLAWREIVRQSPLPEEAPTLCRLCGLKMGHVGDLVLDVRDATRKELGR